eukprot:CAMPEP_0175843454 /NCGR_PEP_ID=MMETSP0107_2-20121207/21098_1 /TAXON_ID=195067 ORGANISM="Goniomonas pacifica, Strain CCMP1869" /NCGR_SAMPLE_ID=MMETSP0107_2 /ASSEMBLY_ACC=CAM_ASM_000203 /LENGTH=85 /DNA_ID=CAMNT_0017157743 /DNA_START=24 /DNA_END=281 /DNA_ORIENTATION=+
MTDYRATLQSPIGAICTVYNVSPQIPKSEFDKIQQQIGASAPGQVTFGKGTCSGTVIQQAPAQSGSKTIGGTTYTYSWDGKVWKA